MSRLVVLDSGVVGLLISKPSEARRLCAEWLARLEGEGVRLIVPDLVDYEVRREVIRLNAAAQLARLDALRATCGAAPVPTKAWHQAAEFWAHVRRRGLPTAAPEALDGDAILAALAATAADPGREVIIATTNVRHLARFPGIDARTWSEIA